MIEQTAAQHAYAAMQRAKGCPPKSALKTLVPLVHAAAFEPAGRQRVALVLAQMHDGGGGIVRATMGHIASRAGLSKVQARKHVHALISDGVLQVVGNAHGGAPGAAPHYRFSTARLQAMPMRVGHTADMFELAQHVCPECCIVSEGGAQLVAQLVGPPGLRRVQFYRVASEGLRDYGQVPLSNVLSPWRLQQEGSWDAALYPMVELEDDYPEEIFPGEFEKLQQWAQAVALGRIESSIEA